VLLDFVLGGLNYQIEHHLFPNMPQPNLRRAQPIVRDYCASLDIDYLARLATHVRARAATPARGQRTAAGDHPVTPAS
jgi:fatty acid desaturase